MEVITLESLKNDPKAKHLNFETFVPEKIEKGHIYEAIKYGKLGEHTVQKTGKEINDLLSKAEADLNSKKTEYSTRQAEIKKLIGLECDDNYTKNGVLYGRYSWRLMESVAPIDSMGNRVYAQTEDGSSEISKYDLCDQFNSLNYRVREIEEDLMTLEALKGVFDENKKYDLELKTLVQLMKKEE